MKQSLNEEFRRMQRLAGIQINEISDDIEGWDTLFEYWEDFGNLGMFTQQDIIDIANQAGVSQSDLGYILDLPQVANLERG